MSGRPALLSAPNTPKFFPERSFETPPDVHLRISQMYV